MDKENTEKLLNAFPHLYRGVKEPPTANLMCFGFECGDGWFNLLYQLSKEIVKSDPEAKALQVKEKYGTLRFYCTYYSESSEEAIDKAEKLSEITCEDCGKPGSLHHRGSWLRTLCGECAVKFEYEKCPEQNPEEED